MELNIRPMEMGDIPAAHAIDVLSFSMPWPESSFHFELTENPSTRLWVAETIPQNGRSPEVVAMLVMWVIIDEGHIGTIAVHPDYRRRGIGRQILTHAIEQARAAGVTRVFLEVRRSNLAAQTMYARLGFEVESVRPRYYRDTNEDALLMTLYLDR